MKKINKPSWATAFVVAFTALFATPLYADDKDEYIKQLKAELAVCVEDNKQLVRDNAQLVKDNAQLVADINQMVKDNDQLVRDNDQLVRDNDQLVADNAQLVRDNAQLVSDNKRLVIENEKLREGSGGSFDLVPGNIDIRVEDGYIIIEGVVFAFTESDDLKHFDKFIPLVEITAKVIETHKRKEFLRLERRH